MRWVGALVAALAGCGGPPNPEECAKVAEPVEQVECWFRAIEAHEPTGGPGWSEAVAALPPGATADMVILRLVAVHPEQAGALCARIRQPEGRRACENVSSRPHIWQPVE